MIITVTAPPPGAPEVKNFTRQRRFTCHLSRGRAGNWRGSASVFGPENRRDLVRMESHTLTGRSDYYRTQALANSGLLELATLPADGPTGAYLADSGPVPR